MFKVIYKVTWPNGKIHTQALRLQREPCANFECYDALRDRGQRPYRSPVLDGDNRPLP